MRRGVNIMKLQKFKGLFLAVLLPTLTGCTFIDKIVADIALNVVFKSDYVISRITTDGGEAEVKQYDPKPVTTANRGDVTYGVESLIFPKSLETIQYGFKITIDFTLEFSEGAEELFHRQEYSKEEGGQDFDFTAEILYPTGDVEKPESMENMGEYLDVPRLIDFKNEIDRDVEITLIGKAAQKTRKQKFYLNLNSKLIKLPGGENEDIDTNNALILEKEGTPKTLDVTIPKNDLLLGKTIPLQVMWVDLTKSEQDEALATISITSPLDLNVYDVTLPSGWPETTLIVNETITDFPVNIKLKAGQPVPADDLLVTFKGTLTTPV